MGWLTKGVTASMAASTVISLILLLQFYFYRRRYLLLWSGVWGAYAITLAFVLARISVPDPRLIIIGQHCLALTVPLFILYGFSDFLSRKPSPLWPLATIAVITWSAAAVWLSWPYRISAVPLFGYIGLIQCFVGYTILTKGDRSNKPLILAAGLIILWGVHRIDYPFLRDITWFRAWGFLIAALINLGAAFAFLTVHFRRIGRELDRATDRLEETAARRTSQLIQANRALIQEIAERKRAETALGRNRDLTKMMVDNLPAWLAYLDTEGKYLIINREFSQRFGVSQESAFGKTMKEVLAPEIYEVIKKPLDLALTGQRITFERDDLAPDGRRGRIQITYAPHLDLSGEMIGLFSIAIDITESLKTAAALHESEERYRSLVELAPVGVIVSSREGIVFANQAAANIFGLPGRDQLIGQSLDRFLHPEDLISAKHRFEEVIFNNTALPFLELRIVKPDGQVSYVESSGLPFTYHDRPAVQTIVLDITARRLSERQNRLLEQAVGQLESSVAVIDRSGKIIYVNPAAREATGLSADQLDGCDFAALMKTESEREVWDQAWSEARAGRVGSGLVQTSGKELTLTVTPVTDQEGEIVNFIVILNDVSRERELERRLHRIQKMEAMGSMAAGIAHEINTPTHFIASNAYYLSDVVMKMTAVLREADLDGAIAESGLDPTLDLEEAEQAAQAILNGVDRISRIITAVRRLSYPGREKRQPCDVNQAVDEVLALARNEYKYVADVTTRLEPDLPLVMCRPAELGQVVLNLVVNAAQAIGGRNNGRGLIEVSTRADYDLGQVVINVSDDGPGVPEDIAGRIFDPFFTTKAIGQGTGLGLAFCQAVIVDQLGGSLDFQSEPDRGTTFTIQLPLDNE